MIRTHLARSIVAILAVLGGSLGLSVGATPTASAAPAASAATSLDRDAYEKRVKKWINVRRAHHGLAPVRIDTCSDRIAEGWSRHLAATSKFQHQNLSPLFERCGATYAGETLAKGQVTPRRIVRLWMNSDGHRRIVLSKTPRQVGIGAHRTADGTWVVAADFVRH